MSEAIVNLEPLKDKYHRAIWAADVLGVVAGPVRYSLFKAYEQLQIAAHVDSASDSPEARDYHISEVQRMVNALDDASGRIIQKNERDRNRFEYEKQRDFMIGCVSRVLRALHHQDPGQLHFYADEKEHFMAVGGEQWNSGHRLWLAVRTELKQAVSLALFRDKDYANHMLKGLKAAICGVITALEHGDIDRLVFYKAQKSGLHLSKDQHTRMLGEGVIYDLKKIKALYSKAS